MRIGPDCKSSVYVMEDGTWVLSKNKVTIPEGWYVVPPSFVDQEDH